MEIDYHKKLIKELSQNNEKLIIIQQSLENKIIDLLNSFDKLEMDKNQSQHEVEQVTKMIHDIWAGPSWKAGRLITYFPRKIIKFLKKLINIFILILPRLKQASSNPKMLPQMAKKALKTLEDGGLSALENKLIQTGGMDNYDEFYHKFQSLTSQDKIELKNMCEAFQYKPLISIIMPVYNTPEKWLKKAIESVRSQIYSNWELCMADDDSTKGHVKKILNYYKELDPRIKICFRSENGHISANSNSALKLATGDFIGLLDHDDELNEDALACITYELNLNPDLKLIYSDEDKNDEQNLVSEPYFKTDWNPDLFLSHNFICHLGVYHHGIVKELGGFREGFEGAQDWDLCLRFVEKIKKEQIRHIPRILYHWRKISGSTALAIGEKSYAVEAGKKAVEEHLQRMGKQAEVQFDAFTSALRVRYKIQNSPLVTLIILTRDGLNVLEKCVTSILDKTTYQNYEILIINNGSVKSETIEYFELVKKHPKIRITLDDRPFNFAALNNKAVTLAKGSIIGLVNNDIEVIAPNWLEEMVSHAQRQEVGVVGARLLYPNDTIQHAGVILGIKGVAGHAHKMFQSSVFGRNGRAYLIQNFSAVTAACILLRKELYNKVGGMDEKNLSVAFNDVDFCLKIREAGYYNLYSPYAELYHHESVSRGHEDTPQKRARFESEVVFMKKKWGKILLNDPFYNPNLTLEKEDLTLAFPPRTYQPWKKYSKTAVDNED